MQSVEIEIKIALPDHAAVIAALRRSGGTLIGDTHELNIFFDRPDDALRTSGQGLRIRIERETTSERAQSLITWKGPNASSIMHNRPSIDFYASPQEAAEPFLLALGFVRKMAFEKRRQSWQLEDCRVELDELPRLGKFVEIEGPSEASVLAVRKMLALADAPVEGRTYASLVGESLKANLAGDATLRF